ncbi:hypothetical protein ABVK25_008670 [Lepraria finkii]|uniref:Uncharacterized protein n=1 Tax=Lepraria finkii TaxID=1340010 RepID=A0ABR4B2E3_9LECA
MRLYKISHVILLPHFCTHILAAAPPPPSLPTTLGQLPFNFSLNTALNLTNIASQNALPIPLYFHQVP